MHNLSKHIDIANGFFNRLDLLIKESGLSQNQFSLECGLATTTISRWRSNGNISGNSLLKICKRWRCSFEWLAYDKGEMFDDPDHFVDVKKEKSNEKVAAYIEPRGSRLENLKESKKRQEQSDDWTIDDMVEMTVEVLSSDTVYKPALAANIRAFNKATKDEREMIKTRNEVVRLRAEIQELKEIMLQHVNEEKTDVEQDAEKRDQANG